MKKHTKGALAAGTAAVLLLGGASTLAFWGDSADVSGSDISTGKLSLSETQSWDWVYALGNAKAGEDVNQIVPGDSITQRHEFVLDASGDNLAAVLEVPDTITYTIDGAGTHETLQLDVDATFEVNGEAIDAAREITEANDGDTITATIKVDFPFGSADAINANDTQNLVASLDDIAVTLTQVQAQG